MPLVVGKAESKIIKDAYKHFAKVCERLSEEFGVDYMDCMSTFGETMKKMIEEKRA